MVSLYYGGSGGGNQQYLENPADDEDPY